MTTSDEYKALADELLNGSGVDTAGINARVALMDRASAALREAAQLAEERVKQDKRIYVLKRERDTSERQLVDQVALKRRLAQAEAVIASLKAWRDGEPYEVSVERAKGFAVRPPTEHDQRWFMNGYTDAVSHVAAILSTYDVEEHQDS